MIDRWLDIDAVAGALDAVVARFPQPRPLPKDEGASDGQRYKLLGADEMHALPDLEWRVRGVLPAAGMAALYGPSGSGKSFLALDMACAIAEGQHWFGYRVESAPVVYVALEGEAGFKVRTLAWEAHHGRSLPSALKFVLQPFKLIEPQDISDLAAVVPEGAVTIVDTLNRAAPTADENASRDMGEILEAAKELQRLTQGLVVLIHHRGKDASKGLRGHSSLLAALDAAIEVDRSSELASRTWRLSKAKDGEDGAAHDFMLRVQMLGTDQHGDSVTSCAVDHDGAQPAPIVKPKLPAGANQRLVLSKLDSLLKGGATGKPGAPADSQSITLEAAIVAVAASMECASDKRNSRARDAITGLVKRGALVLQDGWLSRSA